ncbi:MAG: hypothetical protein IIC79_05390 [Chloroflexi bacterium]|nr:hypothetical protein [Chloroflexota bacterium]
MRCNCDSLDEINGLDAQKYSSEHLQELNSDPISWETEFVCLKTGVLWIMDYPNSGRHGGGPPRLRKKIPAKDDPSK